MNKTTFLALFGLLATSTSVSGLSYVTPYDVEECTDFDNVSFLNEEADCPDKDGYACIAKGSIPKA